MINKDIGFLFKIFSVLPELDVTLLFHAMSCLIYYDYVVLLCKTIPTNSLTENLLNFITILSVIYLT